MTNFRLRGIRVRKREVLTSTSMRTVLFAANEPGFLFDMSDMNGMFQDVTGTLPVTAIGQAVALVLDRSRGAGYTGYTLGTELITNGAFSSSAGWTLGTGWSIANGLAVRDSTATPSNLTGGAGVEIGKRYLVNWTQTGGFVAVYLGTASGPLVSNSNVPGLYSIVVTATVAGGIVFRAGVAVSVGNVSVREYTSGQFTGLGPELVTNGAFDENINGWTNSSPASGNISWSSGRLLVARVSGGLSAYQALTCVVGATYALSYTFESVVNSTISINVTAFTTVPGSSLSSANSGTILFQATSTTMYVHLSLNTGNNTSGAFDNISVRELPGNHAVQATPASRPTYGVHPVTGVQNELTWTEDFDNAAWAKTAVTATSGEVRETTANSPHVIHQAVALVGACTFTLELQAVGRDVYTIWMGTSSLTFAFTYTFSTNTLTVLGSALSNVTRQVLSGGWVRFTGNVNTPNRFQISMGAPGASYIGDPTTGFKIRNAQIERGSTATAYQRVTTRANITEAGVPGVGHLLFDGADDFLVTPTITPGTDKVQVWAGVRKQSDAATGIILELSASTGGNNGSVSLQAPAGPSASYRFTSRGTSEISATYIDSAVAAPITNILTGIGDISADNAIIEVNGLLAAQNTADQGSGNYLPYQVFIGRRGGTSIPFNGRMYTLILRFGPNLADAQVQRAERYSATQTRFSVPKITTDPTIGVS